MRHKSLFDVAVLAVLASSILVIAVRAAPSTNPVTLSVQGRANTAPWIAAAGRLVVVAWGAAANGKADVFAAVSRDGGQTFGTPVQVNRVAGEARVGGELPPRVVMAPSGGTGAPEIVVLWTARTQATEIKTARSRDGGRTFESPLVLQSSGASGDRGWPALTLDGSGTAHAIWLDHRGLAGDQAAGGTHAGHQRGATHDGVAMAQQSALFYAGAKEASLGERELTKGVCYCCKTALATGRQGTIYAAWRHVYPGNIRDIAFSMSRDAGRSFSPPMRVSEDEWAIDGCPDDGPAIAVDAEGTIHLVWPTVIGGTNPEGALFHASSRDGRMFSARKRIPTLGSPKPSHPQILIDRGRVIIAWDEIINGQRVAAARTLKFAPNRDPDVGPVVRLASDGPSLYPVLAPTDAGVLAVWNTGGAESVVQVRQIELP